MKEFLNPEKITIKVHDCNDELHILTAKNLTPADLTKLQQISNAMTKDKGAGEGKMEMLAIMFEKKSEFFEKFNVRVLKNILDYINQEMKAENPRATIN